MTLAWLQALIIGALEGLTLMLPTSESGTMLIARQILGLPLDGSGDGFLRGLCHLACAAAVYAVYRLELNHCFVRSQSRHATEYERLGQRHRMLILCSLVLSIPGIILAERISFRSSMPAVAGLLLLNGFLLFFCDRLSRGDKELENATIWDGLSVGLAQGISVLPGFSRMGLTMTAGIWRGLDPEYSLCFSSLCAVPFLLLRGIALMILSGKPEGLSLCLCAAVLCGLLSYLCLRLFRFAVRRGAPSHYPFISWGMGLFLLVLYLIS